MLYPSLNYIRYKVIISIDVDILVILVMIRISKVKVLSVTVIVQSDLVPSQRDQL